MAPLKRSTRSPKRDDDAPHNQRWAQLHIRTIPPYLCLVSKGYGRLSSHEPTSLVWHLRIVFPPVLCLPLRGRRSECTTTFGSRTRRRGGVPHRSLKHMPARRGACGQTLLFSTVLSDRASSRRIADHSSARSRRSRVTPIRNTVPGTIARSPRARSSVPPGGVIQVPFLLVSRRVTHSSSP
jgi:hypothetical protein